MRTYVCVEEMTVCVHAHVPVCGGDSCVCACGGRDSCVCACARGRRDEETAVCVHVHVEEEIAVCVHVHVEEETKRRLCVCMCTWRKR